jgi:hypothetical protein
MKIKELKECHPRVFQRLYDEWYPHANYYDWWDGTIEDAVTQGEERGFNISTNNSGRTSFYFSGFCSQGDGASWEGTIDVPKWVEWAKANGDAPFTDMQLLWMQEAWRNDFLGTSLSVTTSGNYSHSNTMSLDYDLDCTEGYTDEVTEGVFKGMDAETFTRMFRGMLNIEEEALKAARAYADEYYKILEEEYDYLTSEECFIEQMQDIEYDEEGEEIENV